MKNSTNRTLTTAITLVCLTMATACQSQQNRPSEVTVYKHSPFVRPVTPTVVAQNSQYTGVESYPSAQGGNSTATATTTYSPLTLNDFIKKTGFNPGPSVRLEQTVVPGVYAFRYPNQNGKCAQFVTADLKLMANQSAKGWAHLANRSPLSAAEQMDIGQRMVGAVSQHLIHIGPGGQQPAFTLISAVDCPYCAKLEAKLGKEKIAYNVVPGALDSDNQPVAEAAWQSADPGAAWSTVMAGRSIPPASAKSRGVFPAADLEDVGCMLGGGTPRAIFPSGKVVFGMEAILAEIGIRN